MARGHVLAVVALVCGLVACALEPGPPSPAPPGLLPSARNALRLWPVLDQLLEELRSGKHREHLLGADPKSFDNPCTGVNNLDLVPPFMCLMGLPVLAVQWLPQYSLAWVLDHANPKTLFGIVFLASIPGDVIPERIGEFHNLVALRVASTSAPLPAALSQLTLLQVFGCEEVRGGPVEMPPFDLMPELRGIQLDLVEGGITGAWPTFANHTQLTSVSFQNSGLEARPPGHMFQLPLLDHVDLRLNPKMFNGPLPENISSTVVALRLEQTGATGTIPTTTARLSHLKHFTLFGNELTGTIPSELGALTTLLRVWLPSNQLSGTIPSWLGRLTALESLAVDNNTLEGTLPTELGLLTSLASLSINNNRISGTLPVELKHLNALTSLLVHSNRLTGPVFCFPSAETITCGDNYLTGKPPDQCGDVWTANCDFSGLDDPRCEQRETKCNPRDKQYALFGEGCVHLSSLIPVPASVVFAYVLAVFLWSYRKSGGPFTGKVVGWSVAASVVAALEFASSWATLLAFYFDLSSPLGSAACCAFVLVLLAHGVTGCALCPSKSDLRVPTVLTILLARQLLVEVPWRVVFVRHARRGREANNTNNNGNNNVDHHQGQGMTSPSDGAGQSSRVTPPQQPPANAKRLMLRFTRRAAFVQVVVNAAAFGCQVALWRHRKDSHLAELAMILGGACVAVSALLLFVHWKNEKRHLA